METSFDVPADVKPDWGSLLPREVFQEILLVLRGALPPPGSGGTADAGARRDRTAMAAVASLLPVTAAEGRLAVERELEFNVARKCRAQAASLMRESKSALRPLLRLQERREAAGRDAATVKRAAWVEHRVSCLRTFLSQFS